MVPAKPHGGVRFRPILRATTTHPVGRDSTLEIEMVNLSLPALVVQPFEHG